MSTDDRAVDAVPVSRRAVLAGLAAAPFVAAAATSTTVSALPADTCRFVPRPAVRLCNTTTAPGMVGVTRLDANTVRIQVVGRGQVPANTLAVAVGLAATQMPWTGFVTVYPSGTTRPAVSNLNITAAGQAVQTMAVSRLGTDGAIEVYSSRPCSLYVDLLGSFEPVAVATTAGRFVPLGTPTRVFDSRPVAPVAAGAHALVNIVNQVPTHAAAVVINLSCGGSTAAGYFVAFQNGTGRPAVSHLNCDTGWQIRSSQAIVPLTTSSRQLLVFSSSGGQVVVDVVGYITSSSSPASTDGLFVPASTPHRQMNSRTNPLLGKIPAGATVEVPLPPGVSGSAVAWNMTVAASHTPGHGVAYPARGGKPNVSQFGAQFANQTVGTHTWARCSNLGAALYAGTGGYVFADYFGYFTGSPAPVITGPASTPTPPPPPYTLVVPRLGLSIPVGEGSSSIVDNGWGWIMPGSVRAGELGAISIFAHRTTHGGAFYYLNYLSLFDQLILIAADGRRFTYLMNRSQITGSSSASIANAITAAQMPSLSLVACTKPDGTPTDLDYRLVVGATYQYPVLP